jgi:hypothetical protein
MLMDFLNDVMRCVFFGLSRPKKPRLLSQAIANLNKAKPDRVFVEICYHEWEDKIGGKQVFCKLRGTFDKEGDDISYSIPLGASQKGPRAQKYKLCMEKYIPMVARRISLLKGLTKPIKIKVALRGIHHPLVPLIRQGIEINHPEWVVLRDSNDEVGVVTIICCCEQNEDEEEHYE